MKNNYELLKKLPFILFVIVTVVILVIDNENRTVILILNLLTAIPLILQLLKPKEIFRSDGYSRSVDIFYVSLFFFYFGYFFAIVYQSKDRPVFFTNGFALSAVVALYILAMFSSFVYWAMSKDALAEKYYENIKSNENIPIKEFLKIAKEKEANILAVAGNLKSLNSDEGLSFLKDFLNNNQVNKLELFIPVSAKSILRDIKKKIDNGELAKRIEINIVEPFVFLQGIVFAGQRIGANLVPATKGYYLYKPIVQKEDAISKGGIFVDVSKFTDENDDYSIAIGAYYNHLKNLTYPINGYEFKPGIFDTSNNIEHNHIKETFTLDNYEN